jgi:hypothetical protein
MTWRLKACLCMFFGLASAFAAAGGYQFGGFFALAFGVVGTVLVYEGGP